MTSVTEELRLAAEFAPAGYDQWRKLVDGVLKGAPYEKLVGKTYDGLAIQPIYSRAKDASLLAGRSAAAPWQIMQRVDHPDVAKANTQILTDLENGATGLEIEFQGGPGARGFGIADAEPATLQRLFQGVMFDAGISIALNPVLGRGNAGEALASLIEAQSVDPAGVDLRINYQALSTIAVRGSAAAAWSEMEGPFAKVVRGLMDRGFRRHLVLADGRPIHDAGGSEAQELAFALSLGLAYLRTLEAGGIALDEARAVLSFRLCADAGQFLTSAKFRALRLLWARIEQACGLTPKPLFIAAETAWRMLTQRDPYVNMLRATIAVFSAGLGGANAITVLPHTLALGLPDAFARRVARNTQLILVEESNLARVADPAAGSGGIEALTKELCEAAWTLFQEIEKAGGVFAALQSGLIQTKVAATRQARAANVAKRREVLTGASEFPNLDETDVAVDAAVPVALAPVVAPKISFQALAPLRLAEPFERLRDRSDARLKSKGNRPSVFLANLGTAADFTARATFAKSFFEAGGIVAINGEGSTDPAALAAAYKASGAALACLCSSDKVYADTAVSATKALKEAGARHIYLAGRPGEQEAALRAAGVDGFVFAGCDALTTLEDAYTHLE
ncbi:Methylmalonyl-CoA mutase small subunit (MCM-beta) [Bradyrhizobium sp. STM 3843]|uniref:methylmalonyl-CoA mutase family protein n=1 Tax=Bradyrhizobium sp. STM 3843 TaxID=551947 RepID=UPI0002404334|nr:methylmalonyl-CoA mutase family protein [Bradyrhizobium sp. STM 3843]CCE09178.1 Methylmalonyl-CoA mutase small subunit (MCM-beta) [Bradyrhizobium sp. STM 3843]